MTPRIPTRALGALTVALALMIAVTAAATLPLPQIEAQPVAPDRVPALTASTGTEVKILGALRETVTAAEMAGRDEIVNVAIRSRGPIDIDHVAEKAVSTEWPLGGIVTLARINARYLPKVAALDAVEIIEDAANPEMTTDEFIEPGAPERVNIEAQRARIAQLREHEVPFSAAPPLVTQRRAATGDSLAVVEEPGLDGWYDAIGSHFSSEAWDLGWRGEGVRVGVSDTGVDFATPALVDTWAVIEDEDSPYFGWPQALEAQGLYLYVQDEQLETNNSELGLGGVIKASQTSRATRDWEGRTEPVGKACFKRVLQGNLMDESTICDYRVPWRSRSGVYRFGVHPDPNILPLYGERPGILVVDQGASGVYDTIYVDLDNDHDFTDEKPVTKDDPLSYRDMDGDGWVDLSGGLLYWIADGENPPPGGYLWGDLTPTPGAGEVIAILGTFSGHHGNYCASNVAGQPVVPVPDRVSLSFRDLPGDGVPETLLIGAAPGSKVVGIRRGGTLVTQSTYIYAAYGHEQDREGDELQIISNSYPLEKPMNEGWDYTSRLVDHLTSVNPNVAYVFSSGNGGPGYGSIRDPHPRTGIKIGASTQMGSTGYDSITETNQITWGDIISFSSMGPGSDGTVGVHTSAGGANASGAIGVNAVLDASETTITWGGTSRSTPVASGNLALIYQAFKDKHDRWPTWQEARAILMAGSQYMGYDPFISGSGVIHGGQSAKIAGGVDGVYAVPDVIEPGDYRGTRYRSFPRLVDRGETAEVTLTLHNPGDAPAALEVRPQTTRRLGSHDFQWQSKSRDEESAYYYHHVDYVIPIPKDQIPEGTEMMAIRMAQPLGESDIGLNYSRSSSQDNYWYLRAYQHTDMNGDGVWWHDRNGNGVVNHARLGTSTQLDGILDVDWDNTEWDRYEYMRLGQDTSPTNNNTMWVHHPLERWSDGLYIGLIHVGRAEAVPVSTINFRLDFYAAADWDWLSVDETDVTVPAGGTLDVPVTIAVPEDAAYGYHQGAVFGIYTADRPDASPYHRLTVPVMVNVGATLDVEPGPEPLETIYLPMAANGMASGDPVMAVPRLGVFPASRPLEPLSLTAAEIAPEFGGEAGQDADLPYANGLVRGQQRWGYGPESGDWRFFHLDIPHRPVDGTRLILRSSWDDVMADPGDGTQVPRTDIDSRVFAPAMDRWSDPDHPDNEDENLADPNSFGPHTTAASAASVPVYSGAGTWRFETATDDFEEWVMSPFEPGLNVIMAHNFLLSGELIDVPFSLVIDRAHLLPETVSGVGSGCREVTMTPSFDIPDLVSSGYGLSQPIEWVGETVMQDDPGNPLTASWAYSFTVTNGAVIDLALEGQEGDDLDLFLYYDTDGDGEADTQIGSSTTSTAVESIVVNNPDDGVYRVTVHGWNVPNGVTTFDLTLKAIQGNDVYAQGLPDSGGVAAGEELRFQVCYDLPADAEPGIYEGQFYFGPSRVPRLFALPVVVMEPR